MAIFFLKYFHTSAYQKKEVVIFILEKIIFMKNLLLIGICLGFILTACEKKTVHIQSIHELQPYLEKYLGAPTVIDTVYKGRLQALEKYLTSPTVIDTEYREGLQAMDFTTLYIRYENRTDLSYNKIAKILSKGFGEPIFPIEKSPHPYYGGLIPMYKTPWGIVYKVQLYISSLNPPSFMISVSDDKNEIPVPTQ